MKKQLLVTALGLALTATALAQGTTGSTATTGQSSVSTSSIANSWKALQDSPLSLSVAVETDSSRNAETKKIDGVEQVNAFYLGYKLSPNDSLTFENDYNFTKKQNADMVTEYERMVFKYARKNILTEANNGVAASASVDLRYRPTGATRVATNQYGQARLTGNLSKTLGPVNLALTSMYARISRIDASDLKTSSTFEHVLVQTYNFTDSLSLSLVQDIYQRQNSANTAERKTVQVYAELDKSFTPDFSIGAYVSGIPYNSVDRYVVTPNWQRGENLIYAGLLNLTVF